MIEVKLTFADVSEMLAFFGGKPPAAAAEPKPEKPAKTKPAPVVAESSPSPAPATSAPPAPAPSAPAAAPAPVAPAVTAPAVKYEDSGIPAAVGQFVGLPGSDGYPERRQRLVELLKEFGVATAKALPPEQFAGFLARVKAL